MDYDYSHLPRTLLGTKSTYSEQLMKQTKHHILRYQLTSQHMRTSRNKKQVEVP